MRSSALIIAALLIGLVAAFLVFRVIIPDTEAARKRIVVASGEILAGTAIKASELSTVEWAAEEMPKGAFEKIELVTGRIARTNVYAGEPVLDTHLAQVSAMAGMTAMIAEGKRAISIGADEVIGVAGFAMPGSYVDVLVSAKDSAGFPFSKVVLERIKILAVEQETKSKPDAPKVVNAVTLEMTPTEAERLDLARSVGTLSLVLRNEFDRSPAKAPGARLNDLFIGSSIVFTVPPAASGAALNPQAQPQPTAAPASGRATRRQAPRVVQGVEEIRGTGRMETAQ
ncbi:Flp pilus assembly protein CpaB [Aquisediminimonas sediminicola]|uniref:Flp pilus assembly protein CpaB n=1 Tax=Alteraquisediminimonas sediminicola TaxID=2676787 RepID=UPI001C8EA622|nr:Flp pilus assembly protein CpaB [Aquisediminimonas sediminicola]